MRHSNYLGVFYALLQAGLWEKDVLLLQYGRIDFKEVIQLAEEQSVVGLVTAGLEHVIDTKVSHDSLVPFIGRTLQIEQRNKAMNDFIAKLINLLNKNGIKALLVKGQGVAQCYERPLWRACSDVDHNNNLKLNKYMRKAKRINKFILQVGNMGHNRDYSYYTKYPYVIFKTISLWRHIKDSCTYFSIFPLDSIKVTWSMLLVGFTEVLKGGFSLNR